MAHTVTPCVFRIAQTRVNEDEMRRWLTHLGVGEEAQNKLLVETKTHAEKLTEAAGRRCYMAFEGGGKLNPNVQRIRSTIAAYITNLLEKKDGSVLQHYIYNFAIEGVSRVFTAEMNRHSAGTAISEGSLRYIRFDDIPYWLPGSIQSDKTPMPWWRHTSKLYDFNTKEEATREVFRRVFANIELEYAVLEAIWREELTPETSFARKKELTSMMRRIIPLGVATGGVWSGNVRALRYMCEARVSKLAEEEISLVLAALLRSMIDEDPNLFGDFAFDELGFAKPKYSKV